MLDYELHVDFMRSKYLRNDAVPDETFCRAYCEYCTRALARCAAAVSTAEMLRKPAVKMWTKWCELDGDNYWDDYSK